MASHSKIVGVCVAWSENSPGFCLCARTSIRPSDVRFVDATPSLRPRVARNAYEAPKLDVMGDIEALEPAINEVCQSGDHSNG